MNKQHKFKLTANRRVGRQPLLIAATNCVTLKFTLASASDELSMSKQSSLCSSFSYANLPLAHIAYIPLKNLFVLTNVV